jgi:nitrous-oxide reductase
MLRPSLRSSLVSLTLATTLVTAGCGSRKSAPQASGGTASALTDLMKARGLSEADVTPRSRPTRRPARRTSTTFASGGHGGNLIVIGVPSMRILKYIGVFTPEPWQGYGYGDETARTCSAAATAAGATSPGPTCTTRRSRRPVATTTASSSSSNDKANPRVAVVDLRDFATKQIVASDLIASDHGATFVTPNTDYVIETSQYPAPLGGGYAPISEYNDKYRGAA